MSSHLQVTAATAPPVQTRPTARGVGQWPVNLPQLATITGHQRSFLTLCVYLSYLLCPGDRAASSGAGQYSATEPSPGPHVLGVSGQKDPGCCYPPSQDLLLPGGSEGRAGSPAAPRGSTPTRAFILADRRPHTGRAREVQLRADEHPEEKSGDPWRAPFKTDYEKGKADFTRVRVGKPWQR